MGLGTDRQRRCGCRSPQALTPWREGLGGLGLCLGHDVMDGSWAVSVCFGCFAFFLSNGRFPVLPIPQLPLGSVLPETSQGNSEKPQAQPPPPSRRMRAGLGGKFGARVCKCESGACARAVRGGAVRSHNEANRFFLPSPPRSVVAPARWGNSPGL